MGKSFKRSKQDFYDNDGYDTDKRIREKFKDRRKQKKMKNALKSLDLDYLTQDEDE